MGIREAYEKQEANWIKIESETNKFAVIGYWLRDIKKKLRGAKIYNIKFKIEINYFKEEWNALPCMVWPGI